MHAELSVALNFIISHLYNKLPRRRVDVFAEELEAGFRVRFQGHWYPEEPSKGSAFRCVKIADDKVDPVVDAAARSSGLDISEVKTYLPSGLTVWIDPNEVSYRVGEHGPVQILYRRLAGSTNGAVPEGNRLDDMGAHANSWVVSGAGKVCPDQNFLAAVTTPGLALKLNPVAAAFAGSIDQSPVARGSPVWPGATGTGNNGTLQGLSPVSATSFTAATFAQTKFGSTKMKNHGNVRPSRLSPTSAALPVAAVHAADGCLMAPRLSPTGPNPGIGSGRGGWNHSPTVGMMQSPLAAATGRLSPMQPTSVPPCATYSAQLAAVGATAAIMSGVTPPFANNHGVFDGNGLQDWIVTQNQSQSHQQQQQQPQQQQQQPQHLPQQLQQHLIHAAAAAAASQNNQSTVGSSSTVNGGIGPASYQCGPSRLQRHYQSDPLTNAAVSVGQRNVGFVGERSVYPGVSSALAASHLFSPAGAAALSDASAGRSFSAAGDSGSSAAMETMASLLGQDAVSPLAASLSQVDWSFRSPTAGMVNGGSDLSGSQMSATNDGNNIGVAELQKLLLVN